MPERIERPTLEFSVFFALSKVKLPRDRALSESDRHACEIARNIDPTPEAFHRIDVIVKH